MSHERRMEQLRSAMRLPGNFQKSCKFFCRGLDIRVSEVVYSDLLNTSSASARTFISFMRPDFVKEKILLYNLLILRITSILKIMLVIDNPYGSR